MELAEIARRMTEMGGNGVLTLMDEEGGGGLGGGGGGVSSSSSSLSSSLRGRLTVGSDDSGWDYTVKVISSSFLLLLHLHIFVILAQYGINHLHRVRCWKSITIRRAGEMTR